MSRQEMRQNSPLLLFFYSYAATIILAKAITILTNNTLPSVQYTRVSKQARGDSEINLDVEGASLSKTIWDISPAYRQKAFVRSLCVWCSMRAHSRLYSEGEILRFCATASSSLSSLRYTRGLMIGTMMRSTRPLKPGLVFIVVAIST